MLMDSIICWNVRGLNQKNKQMLVRSLIRKCNVGLVGLLETRIKGNKMGELYRTVFEGWCFTCNNAWNKSGRIVVAWNPHVFHVDIRMCTSQLIHMRVETVDSIQFYITIVYAFNKEEGRRLLWKDLETINEADPCVLLGDFNDILHADDRIGHKANVKN